MPMDPFTAAMLGIPYSGPQTIPQPMPVVRPPVAAPVNPLAAYGGQMGLGEMEGAVPTPPPTPPPAAGGQGWMDWLFPSPPTAMAAPAPVSPTGVTPVSPPMAASPTPTPEAYRTESMRAPPEAYRTEPYAGPTQSLGAALDTGPAKPQKRATPVAPTTAAAANATPGSTGSGPLDALKSVIAPKPPEAQRVGTPHAVAPRPVSGDNIVNLMATLGITPQQAMASGLKLPQTLGQALGGR